jgi:hypothetical protein
MKKNNSIRSIFTALFSAAFVIVFCLSTVQNAEAQRRFDPKATGTESELRNVANFTQELLTFQKQAEDIDKGGATEADLKKFQDRGKRIKDGTSNTRGSLQSFISKIKSANRWNDEFDAEFLDSISNAKVKAFIKRIGGARKALTEAEAAFGSLAQDVDAALNDAKKMRAANAGGEFFFVNASFAGGARKVRLKCVLLGVGVAAAEIGRLKLTAENLDNLFDSNKCGGGGAAATT